MKNKVSNSRAGGGSRGFSDFGGASSFGALATARSSLSYLSDTPDLSSISDSNVVVSFKNLQKKDATTKARALEDLVAYAQSHPHDQAGGVEDSILEAWVQLYPRISIDNSRRVRELSHALQFDLMKSARKRMEKRVPRIVGTWLVGVYDRDKGVARVANEGLSSFLTTDEKMTIFWKRCQPQIIEYASSALNESADTLSDERSTTPDDAEAKYYRVIGGALALVTGLLQRLEQADLEKCQHEYDTFFENDKVLTSAMVNDATVRRISCQLLADCLSKRAAHIQADLGRVSKLFVYEGLKSNQAGSATEYISTLTQLTSNYPTLWTSDYRGKKSALSRLKSFLEKGSQGSNSAYWDSLSTLIDILPSGVLPSDLDGAMDIVKSLRSGLSRREEPRANIGSAWASYLNVTKKFIKLLPDDETRLRFIEANVFPLTEHYISPKPETASWSSGNNPLILIRAYTTATVGTLPNIIEATQNEWNRLKAEFVNRIKNSLPEASKDYERSQKLISDEGDRWFNLAGNLLEAHKRTAATDRPIPSLPAEPSLQLLREAFQLLETRNWKPFGAAATVEWALKKCPLLFDMSPSSVSELFTSFGEAFSKSPEELLKSRSASHLFSSVGILGEIKAQNELYQTLWSRCIEVLLASCGVDGSVPAITTLISSQQAAPLAQQSGGLQQYLAERCVACTAETQGSEWQLFEAVFSFNSLADSSAMGLVKELSGRVINPVGQPNRGVIKGLRTIARSKPELLSRDQETNMSIMASLLSLSERSGSDPEISDLQNLLKSPSGDGSHVLGIVQQNINGASVHSLSVDTVLHQALQIYQTNEKDSQALINLVPDINIWRRELGMFLEETPEPSLAITSVLGGAYFLPVTTVTTQDPPVHRDQTGCSIAGRMAAFTAGLVQSEVDIGVLEPSLQAQLFVCLGMTVELVTDQLTVSSSSKIWKNLAFSGVESSAEKLVSHGRRAIMNVVEKASGWRDGSGGYESTLAHDMIRLLLEQAQSPSPMGLYSAKVLSDVLQGLVDVHGLPSSVDEWLAGLDVLKSTPSTIFPATVILGGLGEALSTSKTVSNLCNRLVSDIAGAKFEDEKTLGTLVLLNVCMRVYDSGELPVANNRLVFAVKQLTSWLESPEELDYRYAAETCRALQCLLPCVKDVYGSYWENTVDFCIYLWKKQIIQSLNVRLPEMHASLRLVSTLQSLEEPNDDLVDILESSAPARSEAMLEWFKIPREQETQPLAIVDSFVCRQVEKLPLEHVGDLSELYGLVASESRVIQTAAFGLLRRALPAAQAQISVDVLLDKKTAQLPDELLSLLLDPPSIDSYSDEALDQFPTPIRSYLLAWNLVFDAFEAASHRIRSDYAEALRGGRYVGPLLDFTFDTLGVSASNALQVDRAGFNDRHIRSYSLEEAEGESEEHSMQWLLIHLFYCVLKYLPGLFRSWHIECPSKQTKIAVEPWMSKYFSPLIRSDMMEDVQEWAANQEPASHGENQLSIKISEYAKEVTVGYEVDDTEASILIKVPQEYPLEGVSVVGLNRVVVNEKKWQSWMMTTQGVITFSGGSIIDGLQAFRRNIVGALKGQTECAICYSIISTDKRTPDKRCQTCKNLFHRDCLYKWMQSSGQNTCPLCRNPIDYFGSGRS